MSSVVFTTKPQVFKLQQCQRPNIDILDFKLDSIINETFSEMFDDENNDNTISDITKPPQDALPKARIGQSDALPKARQDALPKFSTYISPYEIDKLQTYNPINSQLFDLTAENYNQISLNHKNQICSLTKIVNTETKETLEKPVFVKFSPLLDPIRYMIGKYNIEDGSTQILPVYDSSAKDKIIAKMCDPMNASYVDAFFSFLTSVALNTHGVSHGVDYYGSFLGIQKRFKMNIEDDLEYLANSDFFNENIGKILTIQNAKGCRDQFANYGSKNNKIRLLINDGDDGNDGNDITLDFDTIDCVEFKDTKDTEDAEVSKDTEVTVEYENTKSAHSDSESSENSSNNSKSNYSTEDDAEDAEDADAKDADEESEWATDSGADSGADSGSGSDSGAESDEGSGSESNDTIAFLHDFPIQMICLEKCDGTMDQLFENEEINIHNGASALFQIIMTLIIYQKMFDFTHNDLHTNNIMYVKTEQEYIYYIYDGRRYRVPTYGKLYKIIDFGRAIYKFQGRQFCSDSFAPGGDAATQYNIEPFMNKNKPRLEPNPSFDLCRLACSIFDFIIDNEDLDLSELDDFQRIIHKWCLDDNGKNILYKRSGEERYPNFKLYKMIARTVHKCRPEDQLKEGIFAQFEYDDTKDNDTDNDTNNIINIDLLPTYVGSQ